MYAIRSYYASADPGERANPVVYDLEDLLGVRPPNRRDEVVESADKRYPGHPLDLLEPLGA